MWELCSASAVINSDGVIAGLSVTVNRVACVAPVRRLRCLLTLPRLRHVLEIIPAVIHRFFENSPSY
jgi:hypothetical protein